MADVKIKLPDGFGDGMTGQEVTVTNAASEATLEKIVKLLGGKVDKRNETIRDKRERDKRGIYRKRYYG